MGERKRSKVARQALAISVVYSPETVLRLQRRLKSAAACCAEALYWSRQTHAPIEESGDLSAVNHLLAIACEIIEQHTSAWKGR